MTSITELRQLAQNLAAELSDYAPEGFRVEAMPHHAYGAFGYIFQVVTVGNRNIWGKGQAFTGFCPKRELAGALHKAARALREALSWYAEEGR